MGMDTLEDLFIDELKDMLSAEKQLTKALPKMAKKATNPKLKAGFEAHLAETENQIARLEQVFGLLDRKPVAKTCKAMQGLIEEGSDMMKEEAEPEVMDAAIISSAQKIEHYEIASYGTLRTFARQLGMKDAEKLLQATLEEESATDEKLTQLAESGVNAKAA